MGCCSGDADDKAVATVDPDTKAKAAQELEEEEEYEPTGSVCRNARTPLVRRFLDLLPNTVDARGRCGGEGGWVGA